MAYDKVVDSAALDAVFTDIGDAIRAKNGTTENIAHTAMAEAINGLSGGGGQYVWEKNDSSGNFIECVVSDSETAYPESGLHTDGYRYERILTAFSIQEGGKESEFYKSEIGMTWGEWIESEHNVDGYTIGTVAGYETVISPTYEFPVTKREELTKPENFVQKTQKIIVGQKYIAAYPDG